MIFCSESCMSHHTYQPENKLLTVHACVQCIIISTTVEPLKTSLACLFQISRDSSTLEKGDLWHQAVPLVDLYIGPIKGL